MIIKLSQNMYVSCFSQILINLKIESEVTEKPWQGKQVYRLISASVTFCTGHNILWIIVCIHIYIYIYIYIYKYIYIYIYILYIYVYTCNLYIYIYIYIFTY